MAPRQGAQPVVGFELPRTRGLPAPQVVARQAAAAQSRTQLRSGLQAAHFPLWVALLRPHHSRGPVLHPVHHPDRPGSPVQHVRDDRAPYATDEALVDVLLPAVSDHARHDVRGAGSSGAAGDEDRSGAAFGVGPGHHPLAPVGCRQCAGLRGRPGRAPERASRKPRYVAR